MAQVTGCSNYLFTFAGFMGGIIGLLLNKCKQHEIMENHQGYASYKINITFSLLGAGLIFVFFPLLNTDVPVTLFIYSNAGISSYLCMAATVMTVVAFSLLVDGCLNFRDIIMAPIAGGVIVSSAANYMYTPLEGLLLGFLSGFVLFITNRLEKSIGKNPHCTHAVFSLFGVQGLLGGLASAVMRAINKTA